MCISLKKGCNWFGSIILAIIYFILPPLGVGVKNGFGKQFATCLVLTLLGYLPGVCYYLYLMFSGDLEAASDEDDTKQPKTVESHGTQLDVESQTNQKLKSFGSSFESFVSKKFKKAMDTIEGTVEKELAEKIGDAIGDAVGGVVGDVVEGVLVEIVEEDIGEEIGNYIGDAVGDVIAEAVLDKIAKKDNNTQ